MIVITYHAIAREESPVSISKERLCADLDALEDAGYTFVPLSAVSGLTRGLFSRHGESPRRCSSSAAAWGRTTAGRDRPRGRR
jgi:hypothetical protein